jgi:hypothetical protein
MPGLLRKVGEAGEHGITKNAQGHCPDAAHLVAEPAEHQAAGGRAKQEQRGDLAHPHLHELFIQHASRCLHLLQRGTGDEREDAHFQTVEHPAEKRREQHHPLAAGEFS